MIAWLKGLFGAISSTISSPSPPPDGTPPSPTSGTILSSPNNHSLSAEEKTAPEDPEITLNLLRQLISAATHELEALEQGEAADIRAVSMAAMRLKPSPPSIPPRLRSNLSGTRSGPNREESGTVVSPTEGSVHRKEMTAEVPTTSTSLNHSGSKGPGNLKKSGTFGNKGVILPPPQPIKSIGGMTWNPGMSKWEPTSKSAKARSLRLTASLTPVQKWEEIKKQQKQMSKKNKHKMSTITALTHTPMAEEKNGMRLNPDTMFWEKIDGDEPDPFEGIGWKTDEMKQVRDSWNDVRKEFTITFKLRNLWNKSHEKHVQLGGWLTKDMENDNRSFLDNARRLAIKKLISDASLSSYPRTPPYTETPPLYDSSPRGMDFTVVTPRSGIPRRLRLSGVLQKDVTGYIRQDGVDLGRFTTSPGPHLRQESAGDRLSSPKGYRSPRGYASPRQVVSPRHLRELSDPGYRVTSPNGHGRQESGDVRLKDLAARINIRKKSRVSLSGLDSPRSYSPRRQMANVDSPRTLVMDSTGEMAEDWTDDFAPSNQPLRLVHHRLQLWIDADDDGSDYDDLTGGELLLRQEFQSPKTSEKEKGRNFEDDFSDFDSPRILVSDPNIKISGNDFLSKWAESDSDEEIVPTTHTPPSVKIPAKFIPREDLSKWMESDHDDHFEFDFDRRKSYSDGSTTPRPKGILKWDSDTEEENATEEGNTYSSSNLVSPVQLEKKPNKNKKSKKKSSEFSTWAESDSDSDYGQNFTEDLALKLNTKIHENENNKTPTKLETKITSDIKGAVTMEPSDIKGAVTMEPSDIKGAGNVEPVFPSVQPFFPNPVEFCSPPRSFSSIAVFDGRNTRESSGGGYKRALANRNIRKSNISPSRLLKKDKAISGWAENESDSDYDADFGEQLSNASISLTPKKLDSENRFGRDDDEESDYEDDYGGDFTQKIAAFTERKLAASAAAAATVATSIPDGSTGFSSRLTPQGETLTSSSEETSPKTLRNTYPSTSSPKLFVNSFVKPKTPTKPAQVAPEPLRHWVENSDSDSEDFGRQDNPTGGETNEKK